MHFISRPYKGCSEEEINVTISITGPSPDTMHSLMSLLFKCFYPKHDDSSEEHFSFGKLVYYKNLPLRLSFINVSCDDPTGLPVPSYIRGAHLIILVFSVSDSNDFKEISRIFENLRQLYDKDIVILGYNKGDSRFVNFEEGMEIAYNLDCIYYEVDHKLNSAVEELLVMCVENVISRCISLSGCSGELDKLN